MARSDRDPSSKPKGGKPKRARDGDGDGTWAGAAPVPKATVGQRTSHIKNKMVRSQQYHKLKHELTKEKKKLRAKK